MNQLERNLEEIYNTLLRREVIANKVGKSCHPENELSAINLVRYLTLRSFDLRKVHDQLSELGISGLRSSEGYVWKNVTAALKIVKLLNGESWEPRENVASVGYMKSKKLLKRHTCNLFGFNNRSKLPRIMVTMPSGTGENDALIHGLLEKGMSIARFNLSHDNKKVWSNIIGQIQNSSDVTKKECKIYMDLPGPKIRTGNISFSNTKKESHKNFIRLHSGDHLVLNDNIKDAKDIKMGINGELIRSARIGISLPSILSDIKIGDRILFDYGKIQGKVIKKRDGELTTIIQSTPEKGIKLKGGKSINLPDTELNLPTLTALDIKNIPFVCQNADVVGYSFVRKPSDVRLIHEMLSKHGREDIGIVLRIDNKEAFENLPLILFEAMKWPKVGVMIARGDLSVETGPERIAEVQNQILWLCEAAHIPVIWATEVLDSMAKKGRVTRAEVTDAAMSARAECVMLNNGPYIIESVEMLSNILKRMNNHTSKKKSTMRSLKVAQTNMEKLGTLIADHDQF